MINIIEYMSLVIVAWIY